MPIYEFYCSDCHAIYSFFARRVNTAAKPACPRCGRPKIERQISLFSVSKKRADNAEDSIDGIDGERLEDALSAMAGTLDKVDDDPRQAVQAMRRLLEDSGLKMGRTMEEAVRRLEAGEDVEAVEADLSEVMEEDQLFAARPGNIFTAIRQCYLPPRIDPTLYELDSPS